MQRGGHSDEPDVEKLVKVGSQQEAVPDVVRTMFRERKNMSSLQHGKRVLSSDCAAALIGVHDDDTECALAEPRLHEDGISVLSGLLAHRLERPVTRFDLIPQ